MKFQDNVIKKYLSNVYFFTGTPCGGKTSISRAMGKRWNIPVYDVDEHFPRHLKLSDPAFQPSMNKSFKDADEFFGRSVGEYKKWLTENTREHLDFVLCDLIRLSQNGSIFCDCDLSLEQARKWSDPSRIVFLLRSPENLVEEYCNRPDHQDFSRFIHSATDVESAKRTCNETLRLRNQDTYRSVKKSEFFWLDRNAGRSVEESAELVATHFGFIR